MICPRCARHGNRIQLELYNSRLNDDQNVRIRRYKCNECGIRLATDEDISDAAVLNDGIKVSEGGFMSTY